LLAHLKVVRLYVESVLRYGLPAEYSAIVLQVSLRFPFRMLEPMRLYWRYFRLSTCLCLIQPEAKTSLKTLKSLSSYFQFLASKERTTAKDKSSGNNNSSNANHDDIAGEWGAVMEQEYYDFVLFEVPKVVS
jgi:V-type H+-transporting ATPase subunit C